MLTDIQIERNKTRFIELLEANIKREGADVPALIAKLQQTDFFTAPASTQYHCCYKGGLCQHCLNVFEKLNKLVILNFGNEEKYSLETITIVSLLHDLAKIDFYEVSTRNTKDEKGNWIQVPFIKVKETKDRFIYAGHGVTSEYIAGRYIPLSTEESAAIISHMGWSDNQFQGYDISAVFNRYTLAALLHTADLLATYVDERI